MRVLSIPFTGIVGVLALACSNNSNGPTAPISPSYNPTLPTSWAVSVTNPYFPLKAGTTYQYKEKTATGGETITIEVLTEKRTVNGVSATVVRDRVYDNGQLIEDTFDWYAQDSEGNVWYLGESVKDYKNGVVVSTEGSWEWGVDGALPGIQMWANPAAKVGTEYRQEYYKGHAEDWGKVINVGQAVTVPFGSMTNCITIEERVGLSPNDPHGLKSYCPQIGLASEGVVGENGRVELLSRTP